MYIYEILKACDMITPLDVRAQLIINHIWLESKVEIDSKTRYSYKKQIQVIGKQNIL